MEIRHLPLDQIREYPDNAKAHPAGQVKKIAASITEFKWDQPIVVDADLVIIKGHGRYLAAKKLKLKTVPVVVADYLTRAQVKAARLADNKVAESEWSPEALAREFQALQEMEFDLELTGFDLSEIEAFTLGGGEEKPPPKDPGPELDRAAELQEKWGTAPGQIWQAGRHRVMCGDSTNPVHVTALLAGARPRVMIADPPYGIGLDHTWRDAAEANRLAPARKNKVTNDDRFEWWEAFNIQPCPIAYVWHSALHGYEVKNSLEKANYEIRQQIIWVKDIFALSRSAYQWKHEPCWYAVRKGATANWQGGRDKTTVWQAASPIMAFGGGRDDCRTIHPTQKPLDVIRPSIEHHTGKGDAVYDPFLGSGTTMVAAAQLGRVCYGLEIAPEYIAVILERLANMGLTPEMIEGEH